MRAFTKTRCGAGPSAPLVLLACLLSGAKAFAAGPTFDVNSFSDVVDMTPDGVCETDFLNHVCTLRAAVWEAQNYWTFGGIEEVTINLQVGTYTLTLPIDANDNGRTGDLNFYGRVRIVGKGAGILSGPATVIETNVADRLMHLALNAQVTLEDLWMQGGRPPISRPGGPNGGGIFSKGVLTLNRCLMRNNVTTTDGGAIYSSDGTLTVNDSNFRLNSAYTGGAISFSDDILTINRSTFNSNSATDGGALFVNTSTLKITNSTMSDNYASEYGGAVALLAVASAKLNNVTLAINRADGSAPAGGGMVIDGATNVVLSNSILLNTRTASFYDDLLCTGPATFTSNGHNLIFAPGTCPVGGAMSNALPGLLTFGSNGGTMATRAIESTGAAATTGPSVCEDPFGAPLTTDQRGVKRPIGGKCDLGAFEVEPVGDANGDGLVDVTDVFYLINYLFAAGPVPKGRANVNGTGGIEVADVFYLINYLFSGGAAPVGG